MGHFNKNCNLSKQEKEYQANYFAGYLLCPDCVILIDKFRIALNDEKISLGDIFKLGIGAENVKLEKLYKRRHYYRCCNIIEDYEKVILDRISGDILQKISVN